jgi:hypothetical protein
MQCQNVTFFFDAGLGIDESFCEPPARWAGEAYKAIWNDNTSGTDNVALLLNRQTFAFDA